MSTITQRNIERLINERAEHWKRSGEPLGKIAETRDFTPDEAAAFERATTENQAFTDRIEQLQAVVEQERAMADFADALRGDSSDKRVAEQSELWRNLNTGERAALKPGERMSEHPVYGRVLETQSGDHAMANYGTLGTMIRALATGGVGSALIPTPWSAQVIDLARESSAVGRAGATIIPMDNGGTLDIGRKTGNPSAAFRAENTGPTPSDPTFDKITLTARTVQAQVVGSIEFFQDAPNADQLVTQALAEAIADEIDRAALYGGIETGAGSINLPTPPNPRGVLAALSAVLPANVLGSAATNGTTPTVAGGFWSEVLDAMYTVLDGNEVPNALMQSAKLARQYAKAVDSTGQPLRTPEALAELKQLIVNKIPTYTKGTLDTATDLFIGQWSQLLIGQRLDIMIQPLPQLYAGSGQTGVLATWRGDIQLARPSAFAVHRALAGAA